MAERKLLEIDAMIQQLRLLRGVVADCLECGCMNFSTCELLGRVQPEEPKTDLSRPPRGGCGVPHTDRLVVLGTLVATCRGAAASPG